MAGCLFYTGAASWVCTFGGLALGGTKSRIKLCGSDQVGHEEQHIQIGENRFSHLSSWRNCSLDKRRSWCLSLKRKRAGGAIRLKNQHRPLRVNSWVAADMQRHTSLPALQKSLVAGSWRKGYELQVLCEQGQLDRALDILSRMDQDGTIPTVNMYRSLLKACSRRKALAQAKQVHAHLTHHGLESTISLGEDVITALVKCGSLEAALGVFHRLPCRTVFSWTTVISGYTNAGQGQEALNMFRCMQEEGLEPNKYTFTSLLKACGSIPDLQEAKRIHAEVSRYGCESEVFVQTCLVDMYAKCGSIVDAKNVFDELSQRDVVSWTAMLTAYTHQGQAGEALHLYRKMQKEGVSPNDRTFVSVLQACNILADKEEAVDDEGRCIKVQSLEVGTAIHADIRKKGYEGDVFVGNSLITMYGKCGSIMDSLSVFNGLSQRNVVSWTAMLAAYVQQDLAEKALLLYEQMCEECVSTNIRTVASVLQACCMLAENEEFVLVDGRRTKVQILGKGKAIHGDAWRKGSESDSFIASTLISMYGKCRSIEDAQNVFDRLPNREVMSWSAILAAYIQQDEAGKTLQQYKQMREEGVSPNNQTFVSVLQACGMLADRGEDGLDRFFTKEKALEMGKAIHANALMKAWNSDTFVGNTLIRFYAKCGSLLDAQNVFNELSKRDVVSWTCMLSAYIQQGEAEKALALCEDMSQDRVSPDDWTIVGMLQACGMLAETEGAAVLHGDSFKIKALGKVKAIHADAWRKGSQSSVFVCSTLITMYGKCGSVVDALNAFDELVQQSVVAWTAMLAVYVEQGLAGKALELYKQMQEEGLSPNDRTFVTTLQACCMLAEKENGVANGVADVRSFSLEPLKVGKTVHADAWMKGGYKFDVFVGSALITMYGKCGSIFEAQDVFDGIWQRDVVAWTAILSAYVEHGQVEAALQLYRQMQEEGVSPNDRTHVSMLQACCMLAEKEEDIGVHRQSSKLKSLERGKTIHASTWVRGYNLDVFVVSTLISMYGKCESIEDAQIVFDGLLEHDVVSWNAMLTAYAQQGQAEKALQLYMQMHEDGLNPDDRTFVSTFHACGILAEKEQDVSVNGQSIKVSALEKAKALHADAQKRGWGSGVFVGNTVVAMYGKCGSIVDAQIVFDGLLEHDVVSWNAMIAACAQQGRSENALDLYEKMQKEGVSPNEITYMCIIQACSSTGSLDICQQIHQTLVCTGRMLSSVLANTLIHAYGRCASMVDAQCVFDTLPQPSLVSWNALIAGYARQGNHVESLQCYDKMRVAGIAPGGVTFLSLLSACSHAGLVDKGVEYFESMSRDHGITPEIEHYVTMVDLLGRAGFFTEVEKLLSTMPIQPDLAMWLCLLGACRKNGKVILGKQAFDCAVRIQPNHGAAYVLMSNIYADAGLWDRAKEVRESKPPAGGWKKPGQSWIEHEQEVHSFMVEDHKHIQQEQLYTLLEIVRAGEGHHVLNGDGNMRGTTRDTIRHVDSCFHLVGSV